MLVQIRIDLDRRGVQPGLVRERRHAHVGALGIGRGVGHLVDRVGDPDDLAEPSGRQHLAKHLGLEPSHDAEEVGVAAPLAVAVGGALDVGDARLDRRQRVSDRAGGVVVAVDAEPGAAAGEDVADHVDERGRQHAAVGVAQHDDLCAGLCRCTHHLERVGRLGRVAVEEVLGVEEHPPALADQVGDGVADHRQVLGAGGAQRALHVAQIALGDQAHHRRLGVAQRGHLGVVSGDGPGPSGRTESGQRRRAQHQFGLGAGEELGVLRIGAGPAAFDEADPEIVEVARDRQLVGNGKREPLLLRAVAQGGVVDVEGLRVVRKAQGVGDGHVSMVSRRALWATRRRSAAACRRPGW